MSTFTSAPPPLPARPGPPVPDAWRAFGGIWRLTWWRYTAPRSLLGLVVVLGMLLGITVLTARPGQMSPFIDWVINFYLLIIVPIIAFVSGGGAIRDDMKAGTVDYLLTRPVRRPVFVVSRFVAQLAWQQLVFAIVLAALVAVGLAREVPLAGGDVTRLLLAQFMVVAAFLALGYLCGACTSRYLVLGIVYAGTVEMGLGHIPIQLGKLSVLRHVRALLVEAFPGVFELPVDPQSAVATLLMGLIFVAVWLAVAVLVFSVQEFAGHRAKDAAA